MIGAVFSLLLAAASPAPSPACVSAYAPLTNAASDLKAADDALAAKQIGNARTQYDSAMAVLGPLPWVPADASCDSTKFALTKMSLMSRSLVVAVKDGSMTASDARAKNEEMWDGMLPGATAARAWSDHPDVLKELTASKNALDDLWIAEQITWHKPSGPDCAHPNLDPMLYGSTSAGDPNDALKMIQVGMRTSVRRGRTDVLVKLDQNGAIVDSYLIQSSGDRDYDNIILGQARSGKYLPKIANCQAVPSTYTYSSGLVKG